MGFIHLHVHSPFSMLDGASEVEALARQTAHFGMGALALTDHDTLCGSVQFSSACRAFGLQPILGAEITLEAEPGASDASHLPLPASDRSLLSHACHTPHASRLESANHLTLLARDRGGYANLCRLLSRSYTQGGRLSPCLPSSALAEHTEGLICLSGCRRGRIPTLVRAHRYEEARDYAEKLAGWFGKDRLFIELQEDFLPQSHRVARELTELADTLGLGAVATGNVHYVRREEAVTHDVLRAIASGTRLEDVHIDRPFNDERYLRSQEEMHELFCWCPQAVEAAGRIAAMCEPSLLDQAEVTPQYASPSGHDSATYLRHLVYKGAQARYRVITDPIRARLDHELSVITTLGFADYMLMCWDVARWSRRAGIRVTGRGSAADSCVAYALYLTDVDVIRRNLPFARFLTPGKTPDVDLDFPADQRERVFAYITEKYGRSHVAAVCTYFTFRAKAACRDIGKALGLPADILTWLSDHLSHFMHADQIEAAFHRQAELKPHIHLLARFKLLFRLAAGIANFPRHIGSHSSGVVISRVSLDQVAPVRPSAREVLDILELDKDDAETSGLIKLDVLSLRTLSGISDAVDDIQRSAERDYGSASGVPAGRFRYEGIPMHDRETFKMIRASRAIGAFQLESSAQLALSAVLQPECFEDLVASVALIRPGPVRGDAVSRFTACRNGYANITYLHPALIPILRKTYGVVLYQEQAVQVIAAMTGCDEVEADRVRKSLAKHDKRGTMGELRQIFVEQSLACHRDLDEAHANRIFDTIEGWSGYGFIEGHAAAFGLTGYRTCYLLTHYTAQYLAGLLNHQPMGFYSPNTLVAFARRSGVRTLPMRINESEDKSYSPAPDTIRLGLRLLSGISEADIAAIVAAREANGPFASLLDFCLRATVPRDVIENLILAGAFDDLHENRRALLWGLEQTLSLALSYRGAACEIAVAGLAPSADAAIHRGSPARVQRGLPLGAPDKAETPMPDIENFSEWDAFVWSWRLTGVCADNHPLAYLREYLRAQGIITAQEVRRVRRGTRVAVAGLNIRPHRPPTRSGKPVLFSTVEDETEILQLLCVDDAIERCTGTFLLSPAVIVEGIVERRGAGVSLHVLDARPLRLQQAAQESGAPTPPSARTYPGTKLHETGSAMPSAV